MEETTTEFLEPIRPTARAVIRKGCYILVQLKQKTGQGEYLTLPGGRQDPGETLPECVRRECAEEVGTAVSVGRLLHVAEVYKQRQQGLRHQLEFLFECTVPDDYEPILGPHPDPSQRDTIWADLITDAHRFRPAYAGLLSDPSSPRYLGVLDG